MSKIVKIIAGVAVLLVAILGGRYAYERLKPEPPVLVTDRLCQFVHGEKMDCVAVLAGDAYMKPGAIVDFPTGQRDGVPLPVADLMGQQCRVPGVDLSGLTADMARKQPISIPQFTYEVNHALAIGADVEVPKFADFTFKAGPKWSNVSKIEMTNDEAWAIMLDELAAVSAYGSCHIRKSCTDYIRSKHYRVVGTAMVAQGISYKMYDKKNELISLETGAKSGEFTTRVGGSTDIGNATGATVKSASPRVVGVRLMPTDVFDGQQSCDQEVVFERPTGEAVVTAGGGGGRGSIGGIRTQQKAIGHPASLAVSGTEASECDDGFERQRSAAEATARVEPEAPGVVRFSYELRAAGGHYATAAQCLGRTLIGRTGHDNTATATAELRTTIYVVLRSDNSPPLKVSYADMPADTRMEMYDYRSQHLQVATKETVKGDQVTKYVDTPPSVSGSGTTTVATRGPGLYRVEVSFRLNASASGQGNATQAKTASVRVELGS